jgi:hypothetical protein
LPTERVPMHQRHGQRRWESAPGGRHRHCRVCGSESKTYTRRSPAPPRAHPPNAPPQRHVPRAAALVDGDDFTLVQSRRRRHHRAPPRPVPPSLVGLCFNCLAGGHVATRCTFPSRCLLCLSTKHRARNCNNDCSSRRLSLEQPRSGPQRRAAGDNLGPRRRCRGRAGDDVNNGANGQVARGTLLPLLQPTLQASSVIVGGILCPARPDM